MSEGDFLSRWSRRKIEARRAPEAPRPADEAKAPPAPASEGDGPARVASRAPGAQESEPRPLPPVESLSFDSDFSAFMQPHVDGALRRQALKTLLNDPRFNVMDGLDVYIDDYSKPDPLPEGWLEKMNQFARLGNHEPGLTDPPKERGATGESAAEPAGSAEAAEPAGGERLAEAPDAAAPPEEESDEAPPAEEPPANPARGVS